MRKIKKRGSAFIEKESTEKRKLLGEEGRKL